MPGLLISVDVDEATDSWGFVGVIRVGEYEAYRTVGSFATPAEAEQEAQILVGVVLGELLAGAEWRRVRDLTGSAPTRRDLGLSILRRGPESAEREHEHERGR
jgi:hypothetical protein